MTCTQFEGYVDETYMEAIDWKTARLVAIIPIRVGSEKCAASRGVGPLR